MFHKDRKLVVEQDGLVLDATYMWPVWEQWLAAAERGVKDSFANEYIARVPQRLDEDLLRKFGYVSKKRTWMVCDPDPE